MTTKRKVKTESIPQETVSQESSDETKQEQQTSTSMFLPTDQRRRPIYEEIDTAEAKIEQLESTINDIDDEISETSLPSRKL